MRERERGKERGIPFHDLIDDIIAAKFTAQFGFVLGRRAATSTCRRRRFAGSQERARVPMVGRWLHWFMISLISYRFHN